MSQYKLKFKNQSYKPKFKQKELIQIARKICSTDWHKSDIDPTGAKKNPIPQSFLGTKKPAFAGFSVINKSLYD